MAAPLNLEHIMKSQVFSLALLAALATVPGAPAQAQSGSLTRSFVSSSGVDGNPCTIAQPCATFARAYTQAVANGIIAALDPGKYGSITITSGITINGNGWAAITGTAGNNAIDVNVASGNVTLLGLELDGAGSGLHGVYLTSSLTANSTLTIRDCTVSNFTDSGIGIQPTAASTGPYLTFLFANIMSFNNGIDGVKVAAAGDVRVIGGITEAKFSSNGNYGLEIAGAGADQLTDVTLTNSLVLANFGGGIALDGGSSSDGLTVRDSTARDNQYGDCFFEGAGQYAYLFHNNFLFSVVIQNGATVYSDGSNNIPDLASGTLTPQSTQ
jgi:hypothetical protein